MTSPHSAYAAANAPKLRTGAAVGLVDFVQRAARIRRPKTDAGLRAIGQPRWAQFDPVDAPVPVESSRVVYDEAALVIAGMGEPESAPRNPQFVH